MDTHFRLIDRISKHLGDGKGSTGVLFTPELELIVSC